MTSKSKAKELVDKYFIIIDNSHPLEDILKTSKQCALIAIDEIMQSIRYTDAKNDLGYVGYWQKVKQEIKNL